MDKTQKRGYMHGECLIAEIDGLPANAKPMTIPGTYLKIANSETTGNHHVIDCTADTKFFESDGVTYMKNSGPATVRCVHANRHDEVTIPEGTWAFDKQKEYDYIAMEQREVRD